MPLWRFLSTLSLRRATRLNAIINHCIPISIHALLAESDEQKVPRVLPYADFYPRSPCGERPYPSTLCGRFPAISIHALLAESDVTLRAAHGSVPYFYPRSPCGERQACLSVGAKFLQFLSTLSLRRATIVFTGILAHHSHFYPRSPCGERLRSHRGNDGSPVHFYPRSPCGERRRGGDSCYLDNIISIHALLAESDADTLTDDVSTGGFLSTLSLRRATSSSWSATATSQHFYPRSPCGERLIHPRSCIARSDFYPRSPCGERPCTMTITICTVLFLSTLSLRRATLQF